MWTDEAELKKDICFYEYLVKCFEKTAENSLKNAVKVGMGETTIKKKQIQEKIKIWKDAALYCYTMYP